MNPIVAQAIDGREKGQIAVSIATSLALEGAFGIYPERPQSPAPITEGVREVWINLRTLVRNFYGAFKPEAKDVVTPPTAATALLEEMGIVEGAINQHSQGMVSVIFYLCDYSEVIRRFPKANLKQPKTPSQEAQALLEKQTLDALLQLEPPQTIRRYRLDIDSGHPHAFMITHYPVDLLNRYKFAKLELLESHTGVLKGPALWYTKLTNGKQYDFLPFCKFTIQVFGDGGQLFSPQLPSVKKEIIEIAQADHWTPVTTDAKIRASLSKVKNPADRTVLLSML